MLSVAFLSFSMPSRLPSPHFQEIIHPTKTHLRIIFLGTGYTQNANLDEAGLPNGYFHMYVLILYTKELGLDNSESKNSGNFDNYLRTNSSK